MALTTNQLAILTARFGAARFGAARFGFAPRDTRGATALSPTKPFYVWSRTYRPSATWTAVKR